VFDDTTHCGPSQNARDARLRILFSLVIQSENARKKTKGDKKIRAESTKKTATAQHEPWQLFKLKHSKVTNGSAKRMSGIGYTDSFKFVVCAVPVSEKMTVEPICDAHHLLQLQICATLVFRKSSSISSTWLVTLNWYHKAMVHNGCIGFRGLRCFS
jgi:hypothetical protein